jgi:hypothetical protein
MMSSFVEAKDLSRVICALQIHTRLENIYCFFMFRLVIIKGVLVCQVISLNFE